ncbi:metallophosphoesterase family protein [Natronomonas amylolytica]|uniref:metallophosphoesterase family protein n=1 Tax=Natronomonas amylolytica TaxID=3108498 RepID=UPI00300A45B3
MRAAIVSDTHIKSRAAELPEWVREELRAADHVIHAGDFDSRPALEEVRSLAAECTLVGGNMDRAFDLPEVATVALGGVRFVVTHGTGPDANYESRVAAIVDDYAATDRPTVGVSGHTHALLDTTVDGYRLLNPGSATGAWPAQEATMMVAEVADGEVDVEVRRE